MGFDRKIFAPALIPKALSASLLFADRNTIGISE
jgi:hypothetical protein